MDSPDEVLRAAWVALGGAGHPALIEHVIRCHAEPTRHYHTADHVASVLRHVEELLGDSAAGAGAGAVGGDPTASIDGDIVRAAALFHDVVYDPKSARNEIDSAALAVSAMTATGWSVQRLALLSDVILSTASHLADSAESAILLDADLAILGGTRADYRRYVMAVRAEYAFVDETNWIIGRSAVLRQLLDHPYIYSTSSMRLARESQARANLVYELDRGLC